jgi:hypothetical protein
MRKTIIATALLAGGTVGVLAFTVPALAANASTTPVTVEVGGGALGISAPDGLVDLGSVPASTGAQTVQSHLGVVTVTDDRAGTAGWVATAEAPDFTGPQTISTSAAGLVTYNPGDVTVTGTATVAATFENQLYPAGPVETATGVNGNNTAAWNPTITVTIPADALAGTYSTTITHSVS